MAAVSGQAGDPASLIPGNPEQLYSTVAALTEYAQLLTEAGNGLKQLDVGADWSGPAAEAGTGADYSPPAPATGQEMTERATQLGFGQAVPPQRAPFDSHGQPVYTDGGSYITPDGDGWELLDKNGNRLGSYTWDLTWATK